MEEKKIPCHSRNQICGNYLFFSRKLYGTSKGAVSHNVLPTALFARYQVIMLTTKSAQYL